MPIRSVGNWLSAATQRGGSVTGAERIWRVIDTTYADAGTPTRPQSGVHARAGLVSGRLSDVDSSSATSSGRGGKTINHAARLGDTLAASRSPRSPFWMQHRFDDDPWPMSGVEHRKPRPRNGFEDASPVQHDLHRCDWTR